MSMGAEPKFLNKVWQLLGRAEISKLKKSPVSGIKFVLSYFVLLSAYALAFCYGVQLVVNDKVRNNGNAAMYILGC